MSAVTEDFQKLRSRHEKRAWMPFALACGSEMNSVGKSGCSAVASAS